MNRLDAIIEKYFEDGLLTLTGARDKYGYHIITLPAHHLVSMETMDARYFVAVLHRYILWEHLVFQNNPGIALLLNLKNTRKSVIQIITEALTILESKKKTIIQMVYIVKPDTRIKSHLLKKLLGIKPPQRLDNPRQFQIQLVKTLELLRNYIEPGQLSRDYGGMLYHDHQAWLNFYKKAEPCLNSAKKLVEHLPGIKEKVELWEEYASPDQTVEQLHQVLEDIPHQFETLLKECNFENVLEDCKQLLHVLETTDNDNTVEDINNTLVSPVIVTIRKYYQDLTKFHQELVLLYKTAETKIAATCHLLQCHEKSNKIVKSIKEEYECQLSEHPAVGSSLSQAELYRNHFTSSIYQPCKSLISDATDILEDLKKVVTESELKTSITNQLTATIEPFTLKLHTVYETYIQLHIFHTLLTKFGKWYKKVLKFLPEYLRKQTYNESRDKIINMPDEWNYTVDTFLSKHPPPREEHIVKIDHDMPSLLPKQLKQQAHCLAIRTKLLQRLLTSRRLPVKLINAAMTWKDELQPPVTPLKLKPQIKISSPSSASSNEEEEKQRFKPKSPRRKSVQNILEKTKHDSSMEQESRVSSKPNLKIDSPKERFIRLTFTPKDFEEEATRRRFSFNDVVKDTTGSESGIEVVDPEDPYDTIIDKIREVSNSPISSDLKLKYVTNLLRCSLRDAEVQKPRYVKNSKRARRHSKLKSAYGKSVGNLLDMDQSDVQEPKMSSFHSLKNLSEIDVDNAMHPSRSDMFLTSLRPTSSLHDLYSEVERSRRSTGSPMATGMSKWYHGYERKDNQEPSDDERYSDRLQQDLRRLQRCHSERMEEESILEKDKQRLDEIVMEAELFKQDKVENSLRRSHDILQNEEMRLNENMRHSPTWIRNYEDPAHYQHSKSDLGYDSISSPRTFSRTTGSSRPILSSKTSYEDPDYHYETKLKDFRNSGHALQTPSQNPSKASQALGSILPRFNSTEEIDEFCIQLKSASLQNKTVAEVHQSDSCHNPPLSSQYRREDNFLDDTDFY